MIKAWILWMLPLVVGMYALSGVMFMVGVPLLLAMLICVVAGWLYGRYVLGPKLVEAANLEYSAQSGRQDAG